MLPDPVLLECLHVYKLAHCSGEVLHPVLIFIHRNLCRAGDPFARDSRARRPSRDPSPTVEAPTLASHPRATSPPPRPRRTQQSAQSSNPNGQSAERYGQRTAASSVHLHPAHHFDPLNLFSSGQPETYPAFSAHSPLSTTLEGELHHFQQVHTRSRSASEDGSAPPFHAPVSYTHLTLPTNREV